MASRYIISAAHCFFQQNTTLGVIIKLYKDHPKDVQLNIGFHDSENPTGREITIRRESLKHINIENNSLTRSR